MMNEQQYLQDLGKETYEYATSDLMNKRRANWATHNDLKMNKPLIYIRSIPFHEIMPESELRCTTKENRALERMFLLNRYRMTLADDYIIEPYVTMNAAVATSKDSVWGVPCDLTAHSVSEAGAFNPSLNEEEDFEKLFVTDYSVNEIETQHSYDKLSSLLGDSIPVEVNRQSPLCYMWTNDISTPLAKMRGLEQIMWDMYDSPEWLHKLLAFMRDSVLTHMKQTTQVGGFKASNNQNQCMPYSNEVVKPTFNTPVSSPKELWGYMAAQEFTPIGPEFFKEFMFDYQKPIIEQYGLAAYGCCEDLSHKIDIIKELKNLRRIAVSPFADAKSCAEQIGSDYVLSFRPDPSAAVSQGINEDFVRSDMRKHFDIFKQNNNIFDITLKDVETVYRDHEAIYKWTNIVREEIERAF